MGKDSTIEWTHHTFNPWWGCAKVSPGCANCYAEAWAKRVGQKIWGAGEDRRFFSEKHWAEPLKWNAEAKSAKRRKRVFCASMADVFEFRADLNPAREKLWQLSAQTEWLDWLLLTKRPQNIRNMLPFDWDLGFDFLSAYSNVWLGITAENQTELDRRWPHLRDIPAKVYFISHEPSLGPIHIPLGIDWVIAGDESGPHRRPTDRTWTKSLRDQCAEANVAFFNKQAVEDGKLTHEPLLDGVLHRAFPKPCVI